MWRARPAHELLSLPPCSPPPLACPPACCAALQVADPGSVLFNVQRQGLVMVDAAEGGLGGLGGIGPAAERCETCEGGMARRASRCKLEQ